MIPKINSLMDGRCQWWINGSKTKTIEGICITLTKLQMKLDGYPPACPVEIILIK